MENKNTKDFNILLDITRIVAFVSVLSVHFFLNSGYYGTPIQGETMFCMTIIRTMFMVCVPLFIVLSGYLMAKKDIPFTRTGMRKYVFKLGKVVSVYFIATIFIFLYRILWAKENLSVKDCIFNLFSFQQYSWYIHMYVGMYLFIPVLNVVWKSLKSKTEHAILIMLCCVITITPSIFNIYDFYTPGALLHPWLSASYNQIVPSWWAGCYPITYYFIGAFLRDYVDINKMKTTRLFMLFIMSVTVFGVYNIWRSYSQNFEWGLWCDWGSLQNTVNTVLLFLLINSVKLHEPVRIVQKIIRKVSELSLGAYILSWITDSVFYPMLISYQENVYLRMYYFPICVCAGVLSSLVLSLGVEMIRKLVLSVVKTKITKVRCE